MVPGAVTWRQSSPAGHRGKCRATQWPTVDPKMAEPMCAVHEHGAWGWGWQLGLEFPRVSSSPEHLDLPGEENRAGWRPGLESS